MGLNSFVKIWASCLLYVIVLYVCSWGACLVFGCIHSPGNISEQSLGKVTSLCGESKYLFGIELSCSHKEPILRTRSTTISWHFGQYTGREDSGLSLGWAWMGGERVAATFVPSLAVPFPSIIHRLSARPWYSVFRRKVRLAYGLPPWPPCLGRPWLEPPEAGPPSTARPPWSGSGIGAAFLVPATSLGWVKYCQRFCLVYIDCSRRGLNEQENRKHTLASPAPWAMVGTLASTALWAM